MKLTMTLTATGDALVTQRLRPFGEPTADGRPPDPAFAGMLQFIRSADVRFTNLEVLLHDFDGLPPAAESGGTYCVGSPAIAGDLAWMGFNLYGCANNHSMDFGEQGLFATIGALDRLGLVHAGTGRHLGEARSPAYLETRSGRVALISCTSTFASFGRAGAQRPDMPGRPGINPLRYETTHYVSEADLAVLRRVRDELGLDLARQHRIKLGFEKPDDEGTVNFLGARFRAGAPRLVTTPHKGDLEGNLAAVADARRQSDWVIVSMHSHESGADESQPAAFLVEFARACIDAGADAVIGHGPHFLRGIEIYRGRPIFYSLGNFIFQNETVRWQPAEFYDRYHLGPDATPADAFDARAGRGERGFPADPIFWEAVIPFCRFETEGDRGGTGPGRLVELRLAPISLGFGLPRSWRGLPMLADAEHGRRIIADLARLSEPFGTRLRWNGREGVVELA